MVYRYALSPSLKGRWNVASWSYLAVREGFYFPVLSSDTSREPLSTRRFETSPCVVPNCPSPILENGDPRSSVFFLSLG